MIISIVAWTWSLYLIWVPNPRACVNWRPTGGQVAPSGMNQSTTNERQRRLIVNHPLSSQGNTRSTYYRVLTARASGTIASQFVEKYCLFEGNWKGMEMRKRGIGNDKTLDSFDFVWHKICPEFSISHTSVWRNTFSILKYWLILLLWPYWLFARYQFCAESKTFYNHIIILDVNKIL